MFTQEEIAAECRRLGPQVFPLPAGVDGAQLLWAMSGNESSFGVNTAPRHEPAYDVGGAYGDGPVMKPLLAQYPGVNGGPSPAAMSYGPWQLMFCNAPEGYSPEDMDDLGMAAAATVGFLNKLLRRWQPLGLAGIGECWNAGHPMNPGSLSAAVGAYVHEMAANYLVAMPG